MIIVKIVLPCKEGKAIGKPLSEREYTAMKSMSLIILSITILLVLPVTGTAEETASAPQIENPDQQGATDAPTIHVYYFHGDRRCKTCLAIESNAKKVLKTDFTEEVDQKRIVWHAVNTDKDENSHFEEKYNLMFSSLILVKKENGKEEEWKNLEKIWELAHNESKYNAYIRKEIKAYLGS